jgi:hypothetical protein
MKLDTLAITLPKLQAHDCVVTFVDGDSYEIRHLDIQGWHEDEFEISVAFRDCLNTSATMKKAWEDGHLKTPRVSWTSEKPMTPVGKTYLIQEVQSIFDRAENYAVYERNS